MIAAILVLVGAAGAVSSLRWLRVAQREHYLAGTATRFAQRWWMLRPLSVVLLVTATAGIVGTFVHPAFALLTAGVVVVGPPGLALKGRTSPLAWTPRLRRLAAVTAVLLVVLLLLAGMVHPAVAPAAVLLLPALVDLSLAVLAPLERSFGSPWVDKAAQALSRSEATVVAVTGSYGKTSTKGHIAHLLAGARRVLPSPASFNNRMGLARAINEHLAAGIDVFVAEMGTYGRGEISELCAWIPPDIAVITAIGPVHLERFGSEDRIVEAKAEILERASTAVLNVDDERLRNLAEREKARRRVITVGSRDADVLVEGRRISVNGEAVGEAPGPTHSTNVGCAVAVATALDVPVEGIRQRLRGLTEPQHRLTVARGSGGAVVIDDTFNSNPAGARAALAALYAAAGAGKKVVVTPGMVELGSRQEEENRRFAAEAARAADHLLVVGRTNRRALQQGAREGKAGVVTVSTREEAVEWVRSHLGPDDAVLYENDLPDHYP